LTKTKYSQERSCKIIELPAMVKIDRAPDTFIMSTPHTKSRVYVST